MIPRSGDDAGAASESLHPGFHPYRRLRDELLGLPCAQWVARCNRLASGRDLRSSSGAPIHFVVDEGRAGALGYEAAILSEGRIACRPDERGALHDLHNALTWLTFPLVKATFNRLHLARPDRGAGRRGRIRDAVTLLDENGLLWLSDSVELNQQLLAKDWQALLVRNRDRVRREVIPVIIGHGLLEKLARPYKAMTAHCMVCATGGAGAPPLEPAAIDAAVAAAIAAGFDSAAPPRLAPLPILGLPAWDPANTDRSYYDDARVFRVQR